MKIEYAGSEESPQSHVIFFCPGCEQRHAVPIKEKNPWGALWTFNGDMEKPTLAPSVHYPGRCHFHLESGILKYCGDCDHPLAGKIVPLPDLDQGENEI